MQDRRDEAFEPARGAGLRAHALRVIAVAVAGSCLALLVPASAQAVESMVCRDQGLVLNQSNGPRVERALLCLTNQLRVVRGVSPLRRDTRLTDAARRHSRDMVERRYFDHEALDNEEDGPAPNGRTPRDRAESAGWPDTFVGENIAIDSPRVSARSLFSQWRQSPGHRANMLSEEFRSAGFGVVLGYGFRDEAGDVVDFDPTRGGTATQMFGGPGADTNDRALGLLTESRRCRKAKRAHRDAMLRLRQAQRRGASARRTAQLRQTARQTRQVARRVC